MIVTEILEQVFEEILRAIERNDFKESQRRITLIKFVAEAYNYKLILTDTLFDLMYRLINYDIEERKEDIYLKSLDANQIDSFRIRLICFLIDSLDVKF